MYFGDNSSHGSVENIEVPRSRKFGGNDVIRINGGTAINLRKYLKRMVPDLLEYAKKCANFPLRLRNTSQNEALSSRLGAPIQVVLLKRFAGSRRKT